MWSSCSIPNTYHFSEVKKIAEKETTELTKEQKKNAVLEGISRIRFSQEIDMWPTHLGNTVILVEYVSPDKYKVLDLQVRSVYTVDEKGNNID